MRTLPNTSKNTRLQITFTINPDVMVINRTVYSTFMLLGDVGGFSGLLYAVGASIVSLLTYNDPENRLVEKLFVVGQSKKPDQKLELNSSKQLALKEYLQDVLPKCCLGLGCFRRRSRDKQFLKARKRF